MIIKSARWPTVFILATLATIILAPSGVLFFASSVFPAAIGASVAPAGSALTCGVLTDSVLKNY